MLQGEHSAIPLTFIKLPFVIKIFVLSIFEWLFYTGFTVPFTFLFAQGRTCGFVFILLTEYVRYLESIMNVRVG